MSYALKMASRSTFVSGCAGAGSTVTSRQVQSLHLGKWRAMRARQTASLMAYFSPGHRRSSGLVLARVFLQAVGGR